MYIKLVLFFWRALIHPSSSKKLTENTHIIRRNVDKIGPIIRHYITIECVYTYTDMTEIDPSFDLMSGNIAEKPF